MTIKVRRKFSRRRGSSSHGWGGKKKHRGAGSRGGRGMAGSGKRADTKKPSILNEYGQSYYGKRGFHRPPKTVKKIKIINIQDIEKGIDKLLSKGLITKEKDFYVVDVAKLGYQKVLAKGRPKIKFKIKSPAFSKLAIQKIEAAGGQVIK